jgi:hypothetical protein
MLYVAGNIIFDVANIGVWIGSPSSQTSLQGGPIAKTLGSLPGLAVGSAILIAVSVAFSLGLFGLIRKQKRAPILIIATAVANRLLALLIFEATYSIFYAGTVFLLSIALLDYWLLSTP